MPPAPPPQRPPYVARPLGAHLLDVAAARPDACHCEEVADDGSSTRVTFAQSRDAALAIAARLLAAGLKPDQPVAVLGSSSPLEVQATFAVWLAGGVLVPLDPQWEPAAHGRALRKARAVAGIALPGHEQALAQAASGIAGFTAIDAAAAAKVEARGVTLPEVDAEARALILFTSGTTGEPKAAVLRHRALGWNAHAVLGGLDVRADDNILVVLPLHHVFGLLAGVIVPPMSGARCTFPPSLKAPDVARTMREHKVTLVPAVPQLVLGFDRAIQSRLQSQSRLLRMVAGWMAAFVRQARAFGVNPGPFLFRKVHEAVGPDLRLLGSAGAALDPLAAQRLWSLGFNVIEAYGLTETGPAVSFDRIDSPHFGSVGFPLPGAEVRIESPDATGAGEIVVRSPSLFDGYLDAPEETAAVLRDGRVWTGDLGRFDADGRLWVTGRSKEVIVLGSGKNVYPHEVEARLEDSPYIKECCVVGLPEDGRRGTDKLHAVVVPDLDAFREAGESRIEVTLHDQVIVIGDSLPSHHRVVGVTVRTEPLPRTALGKLKRFEVYRDLVERRAGTRKAAVVADVPPPASPNWPVVVAALRRVCGPEMRIVADSNIELDLGLDSLGRVEALAALEEELGSKLSEGFGAEALTAGELLKLVDAWAEKGEEATPAQKAPGRGSGVRLWSWQRLVARPFGWVILALGKPPAGLLARLFWQFEVTGRENLPEGPCIVCPNHGSYVDAVAILLSFPARMRFTFWSLGDAEIFAQPFMRLISVLGNIIRVRPGAGLKGTLDAGGAVLQAGDPLLLFPEGARAPEGERLVFRRGAAILARSFNAPIVPTWLEGMDRLLPRGTSKVRTGHRIAVRFGRPIDPHVVDSAADPGAALTELVRAQIMELGEVEARRTRELAGKPG